MAVASPESKKFAADLLFERGFDGYPVEDLDGMEQRAVSAMIQDLLARDAVAATTEQVEQIAALAAQLPNSSGSLGRTIVPGSDRAACRRQIQSLTTELNSRKWRKDVDSVHADLDAWASENGIEIA